MGLVRVVEFDFSEIYDLSEDSGDIYVIARNECIRNNWRRFPYPFFNKEVDDRLKSQAKSKNMKYDYILKSALRNPVAWANYIHPLPEKQNYQEKALYNYLVNNGISNKLLISIINCYNRALINQK